MKQLTHLLTTLLVLIATSCTQPPKENPYKEMAEIGNQTLCKMRDSSGIWLVGDIGWWNSANQLTALLRYAKVSDQTNQIESIVEDIFNKARKIGKAGDFINDYNDDQGWWLLAWLEAYNIYKEPKYLEMAKYLFKDLKNGYDQTCQGGIYWKKPNIYKNAIANNLFNLAAIRLFKTTKEAQYMELATINGRWFIESGMIQPNGIVKDGLDKECKPKGHGYTYNSGVAIAWLTELYLQTKESEYLNLATKIANSAIKEYVTEEGILKERNEPNDMGSDQVQFKGIFMRHLALLTEATQEPNYKEFILKNADAIIENAYDSTNQCFGSFWNLRCDKIDAKAHSSAWETIIEAYNLSK